MGAMSFKDAAERYERKLSDKGRKPDANLSYRYSIQYQVLNRLRYPSDLAWGIPCQDVTIERRCTS